MMLEEMIHDAEHPLSAIKEMLSEGNLPDLLLHGPPGTGKTTTAHAIAQARRALTYTSSTPLMSVV